MGHVDAVLAEQVDAVDAKPLEHAFYGHPDVLPRRRRVALRIGASRYRSPSADQPAAGGGARN